MKRIMILMLALTLLMGAALAEGECGSAMVAAADGSIYFSRSGVSWTDGERVERISDGTASYLHMKDGELYYVNSVSNGEDEYDAEYIDTLWVLHVDGSRQQIGGERRRGETYTFAEEGMHMDEATRYYGYTDMTVYGDYIYFIGNDEKSGTYITSTMDWGENNGPADFETRYQSGAAVYRMNLDGSNLTLLISDLGNAGVHMSVSNGRIAVASSFRNAVFAYDFTDFMLYDLAGNFISKAQANGDENHNRWMYKKDTEFTVIVTAIQTDGENIYASLGDSEGDFASSRLVNVNDVDATLVYEAFYTPSLVLEDGILCLTSDEDDVYWSETLENTVTLRFVGFDGSERILACIPKEYVSYNMNLYLDAENQVYLWTEENLLRVSLEGGAVEELTENGFAVCDACASENYGTWVNTQEGADEAIYLLPESDSRLISREELEGVDADTLAYMRNEILARHGYPFKKARYQEYFGSQSWYEADPDFDYGVLSKIEMQNVETIKGLEAEK